MRSARRTISAARFKARCLALLDEVLPLTPAVAVASAQLGAFRGDPADRLIVAAALTHGAVLLTRHEAIRDSGLVRTAW